MFDRFPRADLAHLPTPIEPLERMSRMLGGPAIWIKRDDQTGLATGGNKARKLEFLIGDAMAQGADTLVTTGGPQSNHCRQTAAAAARCGLRAVLALTGDAPARWSGNLLLDDLLGAEVRWLGDIDWNDLPGRLDEIAEGESQAGYHPYIVPLGGSSPVGALGYAMAMQEMLAQAEEQGVTFDRIVFGTSSGGTQAGMLIGAELFGFDGQITAISIAKPESDVRKRLSRLVPAAMRLLERSTRVSSRRIEIVDRYLGEGYAVVGDAEREAIRMLATHEGILIGPVYTGRALAGMIDMIRQGEIGSDETVLFWHTGDTAALFAFEDVL